LHSQAPSNRGKPPGGKPAGAWEGKPTGAWAGKPTGVWAGKPGNLEKQFSKKKKKQPTVIVPDMIGPGES
jgi:hypothetical protein